MPSGFGSRGELRKLDRGESLEVLKIKLSHGFSFSNEVVEPLQLRNSQCALHFGHMKVIPHKFLWNISGLDFADDSMVFKSSQKIGMCLIMTQDCSTLARRKAFDRMKTQNRNISPCSHFFAAKRSAKTVSRIYHHGAFKFCTQFFIITGIARKVYGCNHRDSRRNFIFVDIQSVSTNIHKTHIAMAI